MPWSIIRRAEYCRFECSRLAREDYPTEMSTHFNSLVQTGVPVSRQTQNLSYLKVRRGEEMAFHRYLHPIQLTKCVRTLGLSERL